MIDRPRYHHGDLRNAVLEAALRVVASEGVENFTIARVAREVGVSAPAVYRHFADREDLLGCLAASGFEALHAEVLAERDRHPRGSVEALIAIGQTYVAFVGGRPELFHLMWGAMRERREHEVAIDCSKRGYAVFQETLRELLDAEEVRHIDVYDFGTPMWAMVHGLASLSLAENQMLDRAPEKLNALIDAATRAYLAGVKREAATG